MFTQILEEFGYSCNIFMQIIKIKLIYLKKEFHNKNQINIVFKSSSQLKFIRVKIYTIVLKNIYTHRQQKICNLIKILIHNLLEYLKFF